ncbi:hypothetical protein HC928_17415, partial [bacterium]|nr:hypothetical protein [bacterium]
VQTYRWRKGVWASRAEPRLMHWPDLIAEVDGPAYVVGEIDAQGQQAIAQAQHEGVSIKTASPALNLRRAGFMAELAWSQLSASTDPATDFAAAKVLPLYVKTDSAP